ncbi:MAG: DUF4129 domain-containing protein [Chloroflexi bacterium]|nr:DUF4129 domain-containing protein [Chloroflexota bacterium]
MKLGWRRAVPYVTTAGMESCWLYAIAALLNTVVAGGRLSIPALFLVYAASFALNGLLLRRRWRNIWLVAANWLSWAVAMLLMLKTQLYGGTGWSDTAWLLSMPQAFAALLYTFRPELLLLIGSGAAWWLGSRLARVEPDFAVSVTEFQFGLAVLVLMFFTASQLTPETAGSSVPLALTFFLFALVGISVTHAQEGTSWLSGLQRGHWSGILALTIIAIILLGLSIWALVTPDLLQKIIDGIEWLWSQFMRLLEFLASLLPKPEPGELPDIAPLPKGGSPEETFNPFVLPEVVQAILRMIFNIIVIGLVVMALWRISSQILDWLRRRSTSWDVEVESLDGAFKADLLAMLKFLFALPTKLLLLLRFKRKSKPALPEIRSVRQIYRQMLKWASSNGYPRGTAQTPYEYLQTLLGLLPQSREDLEFVTSRYVSTRYSALVPTGDELEQLRESWHRIKQNRFGKRKN